MLILFISTGNSFNTFSMTNIVHMYTTNTNFNTIKCSDSATVCEAPSYLLAIEVKFASMHFDSFPFNANFELQLRSIGGH